MSDFFSATYAEARERFLAASHEAAARLVSYPLPALRGAAGEELAIDVAWVGAPDAAKVFVVTSGTHGAEGFCGAGVQVALLRDAELRAAFAARGIAMLLIHAVNPYGFSHLHRTNEDNVDLNRNAVDFGRPLPVNAGYAALHALLVPATWPPSPQNEAGIAAYIERHGMRAFQAAIQSGQYEHADGLFYGGRATSWSVRTLADVLRSFAGRARDVAWIDVHTGLGPCGHGEKILVGSDNPEVLTRAQRWWGIDVTPAGAAGSVSADVSGPVCTLGASCCSGIVVAIGLEYGTVPLPVTALALRADAWRRSHPDAPEEKRRQIARELRDVFYVDRDDWRGMVLGQARAAAVQAMLGLAAQS